MKQVASVLVIAVLFIASMWAWLAAPCGVWKFSATKDVPARCLMEYSK